MTVISAQGMNFAEAVNSTVGSIWIKKKLSYSVKGQYTPRTILYREINELPAGRYFMNEYVPAAKIANFLKKLERLTKNENVEKIEWSLQKGNLQSIIGIVTIKEKAKPKTVGYSNVYYEHTTEHGYFSVRVLEDCEEYCVFIGYDKECGNRKVKLFSDGSWKYVD